MMQKWQERRRQKAHVQMVGQARPTIVRYSRSRQKQTLNNSRSQNINMPFRQVLTIFQLQKYQKLLVDNGFPDRIKEKQSIKVIDNMMKNVDQSDQDRFYSLMKALLSISTQTKNLTIKRTPLIKKSNIRNLPPTTLSSNLKKCDSIATKKNEKNTSFRIKTKSNFQQSEAHSVSKDEKTVLKRVKAFDDSSFVHTFGVYGKSTIKMVTKSNSIVRRIQQKLKTHQGKEETNQKDLNLYYKQIKDMYLSYDNATLTSNIANVDIQEIIYCFARQIENRISHIPANINPEQIVKNKKQLKKLLKQSFLQQSLIKKEQQVQEINDEINQNIDETLSRGSSSTSQEPESQVFWDMTSMSVANDLSCFKYQYEDQTNNSCSLSDIKNFIQLVMMAGKLQKETPIMAYAYIIRLLRVCYRDSLDPYNWKNIVLITLIEASKIWDDQSLENHSFAKVIKPYTTLQINRLQRHLLTLLGYNLKIGGKQYCQSYFNLRKHASKASKTVHLMPLTLQTIKKLQTGTKKCERNLKETFKKKLNQSF